ncbi:two-component system regulatory protein YycI [Thermoanaerobacterium sp. CMT5567-10]|uniref:two-component system regulatory protein YycI n=1 Tax=Thermoanaerobacterium sp. CMT5567-10 TaxID=3061989 RepID=UPI0026DEAF1E|nr:two-component system regulatory protein YycI [Thermoanaerobacterium sp. CMT5567-10]WKV07539.1 two-component system regulatory protein YycI [Thermoanaerobacterium sp. CMT5567-10]
MDWSKAKTILILIFAVLNMILYLGNLNIAETSNSIPSPSEIKKMNDILKENNIVVKGEIPKDYKPMPMLLVKLKNYNKAYIESNFLNGSRYISYDNGSFYNIENGTIEVKNGFFYYKIRDEKFTKMDKDDAFNYIKSFVKSKNLEEKYSVVNEYADGNKYTVEYTEVYNGINVDVSYMKGVISNDTFLFESTWLIPIREEKERKEIIPPINALLKLLDVDEGHHNIVVKEIKPVYFFSWRNADTGEAIPTWRITTENSVYYVNAYTGTIEER